MSIIFRKVYSMVLFHSPRYYSHLQILFLKRFAPSKYISHRCCTFPFHQKCFFHLPPLTVPVASDTQITHLYLALFSNNTFSSQINFIHSSSKFWSRLFLIPCQYCAVYLTKQYFNLPLLVLYKNLLIFINFSAHVSEHMIFSLDINRYDNMRIQRA